MPAPSRLTVLTCAALAVASPLVAGAQAWRLVDEEPRSGATYLLLYWPSILIDQLPPRAAEAFTLSALPTVLLYFGGYLALGLVVQTLWRRLR